MQGRQASINLAASSPYNMVSISVLVRTLERGGFSPDFPDLLTRDMLAYIIPFAYRKAAFLDSSIGRAGGC